MCIYFDENKIFSSLHWAKDKNKINLKTQFPHLFYLLAPRMGVPSDQTELGSFSQKREEPGNEVGNVHKVIRKFRVSFALRNAGWCFYSSDRHPCCPEHCLCTRQNWRRARLLWTVVKQESLDPLQVHYIRETVHNNCKSAKLKLQSQLCSTNFCWTMQLNLGSTCWVN